MNCAELKSNLEAYALDALDPRTKVQVERHLKTCKKCRRSVQEFESAASALPRALSQAAPLQPPAALKRQLMRAVQAEVQAHAIRETIAPHASRPPLRIATSANRSGARLQPRVAIFSFAALVVIIMMLLVWSLFTRAQMQQALSNEQAARQQVVTLQKQQELAIPVLNSRSTEEIVLHAVDTNSTAYGKVLVEPYKPTVVFVGYNLPQISATDNYALWTTSKGVMQQVGTFTPNSSGFAMVVFVADRNDPLFKELLVTRQSPANIYPSSDRVLVWKSDPNDFSEEVTYGTIFPYETETETIK